MIHSLAETYLRERGITEETVLSYGLEIEEVNQKRARERLGQKFHQSVNQVIWIPVHDASGNLISIIARPLPTIANYPKFLCPLGSNGIPYIPKGVHESKGRPLVVTEGPIKALACVQAGVHAVGLNGVWCAANPRTDSEPLTLRPELAALCELGRKICLGFDADQNVNPKVRQALIRLAFLWINAGTEVLQLTSWPLTEGKGLDDYLVKHSPAAETLASLMQAAKPFLQTLSATLLDAQLVQIELPQIQFRSIVLDQLIRQLAHALGVRTEVLRDITKGPANPKPGLSFAANFEPWPEPVNAEELFGQVMLRIGARRLLTKLSNGWRPWRFS